MQSEQPIWCHSEPLLLDWDTEHGLLAQFQQSTGCIYLVSKSIRLIGKRFCCLQNSTETYAVCLVQLYSDLQTSQLMLNNQLSWIWISIDYWASWGLGFGSSKLWIEAAPYLYGESVLFQPKPAVPSRPWLFVRTATKDVSISRRLPSPRDNFVGCLPRNLKVAQIVSSQLPPHNKIFLWLPSWI